MWPGCCQAEAGAQPRWSGSDTRRAFNVRARETGVNWCSSQSWRLTFLLPLPSPAGDFTAANRWATAQEVFKMAFCLSGSPSLSRGRSPSLPLWKNRPVEFMRGFFFLSSPPPFFLFHSYEIKKRMLRAESYSHPTCPYNRKGQTLLWPGPK